MDELVEYALRLPAAILIRNDPGNFADSAHVGYEVGIQQPRQHRRFANFFRHGEKLMMYFKHNAKEVAELYERFPQVVLPSEIATKYWSKMLVENEPQLGKRLLETSHRLLCEAATKQGRKMIEKSGKQVNRFLSFHMAAMDLSRLDNVYLRYSDYEAPRLSVGIRPFATFSWNSLNVRIVANDDTAEPWQVLEPDRFEEWSNAMTSAARVAAQEC